MFANGHGTVFNGEAFKGVFVDVTASNFNTDAASTHEVAHLTSLHRLSVLRHQTVEDLKRMEREMKKTQSFSMLCNDSSEKLKP